MYPELLGQFWLLAKDWGHGIAEGKDCGPIVRKDCGVIVFRPCRAGNSCGALDVCNASIGQIVGFPAPGLGTMRLEAQFTCKTQDSFKYGRVVHMRMSCALPQRPRKIKLTAIELL